jgi:hypothetical protein
MTAPAEALRAALADRYTLERELGRGGMATVWLAHDLRHDRPVALKVLHPELSAGLGPERFLREIRTTARLDHPDILPLLDSGEAVVSRESQVVSDSPTTYDLRPATFLWYTRPRNFLHALVILRDPERSEGDPRICSAGLDPFPGRIPRVRSG